MPNSASLPVPPNTGQAPHAALLPPPHAQHSAELFRIMIESVEEYAIFALDRNGLIVSWNTGAERLFGFADVEAIGQPGASIFTPEDRAANAPERELHEARTHGKAADERWHLRKDGSRFWASGMMTPLRDDAGDVYGFVKVARDQTAQKQAQDAQSHFRSLFESAPGAYLVLTPDTFRIVAASDAYLHATMTERADIIGKGIFDVFPDAPDASCANSMRNLQVSFERVRAERRADVMAVQRYPIRRPASHGGGWEERWWSPLNSPVFCSQGELAYIIHRVEDVTAFVRHMQQEGTEARGMGLLESRAQHMEAEIVLRAQELQQVNQQLRATQDSLTIALEAAQLGTWDLDLRTDTARRSARHAQLFGYSGPPQSWGRATFRRHVVPEDRQIFDDSFARAFETGMFHLEVRVQWPDGSVHWITTQGRVYRDDTGTPVRMAGVVMDSTERKQAEEEREHLLHALDRERTQLDQERTYFESVLESISDAFYALDKDFRFTFVNKKAEEWWGRKREDLLGQHAWTVFAEAVGSDSYHNHVEVMTTRLPLHYETFSPVLHRWVAVSLHPTHDGGLSAYFQDISERKQAEEQLHYQATHDTLTDLRNRATFLDHVQQALARRQRHPDYGFAVLFLDLDRFKVINDSLGHHVGDQLLTTTARRLEHCVRPQDVVARLGGDEFTILLDGVHDEQDAIAVAKRIHAAIATPIMLDGHEVMSATSIGITISSGQYTQPEEILRDADTAMYSAKRKGAGRHAVFNSAMHTHAVARLRLETELGRAVERNEFRLHYQPLVELATGRVRGFEALLRWQHPRCGLVSPAEFIGVAEETGLIHAIGSWVLREACHQMHRWHQRFPNIPPWVISVNLSGVQCTNPDLVAQVEQILGETALDPRALELEITESVLLGQTDAALALFQALQALGVTLTLDDFGTGYSSLSYLHRFPVTTLKVDRSFIASLDAGGEHGELVRAIVTLAQNLHMDVVGEGVETVAQRDHLALLGCTYGQGYFFARPMDASAVEQLLTAEHALGASIAA